MALLLLLAAAHILVAAWRIQVAEHDEWTARATSQVTSLREIPPARGSILDTRGRPIALHAERYEIGVAPREVPVSRRGELGALLHRELGIDSARVVGELESRRAWWTVPARAGAAEWSRIRPFPGIHVIPHPARVYPSGAVAMPLIGRLGLDGVVQGGLEARMNGHLIGEPGVVVQLRDVRGRARMVRDARNRDPEPGRDLYLTIDLDVQRAAEEALRRAIRQHQAQGGDVVVVDPHTGALLAAVGLNRSGEETTSFATQPTEPGSTLKPFAFAPLLANNLISWTDTIDVEGGSARVRGRLIRDVARRDRITFEAAFHHSSNIAIAKAIHDLEPAEQYAWLRAFGFGERTALSLPGEGAGVLRDPSSWSGYSQGSLAIGYEMSATSLQLAQAYSAIASGGWLYPMRLVRTSPDDAPDLPTRILSEEVALALRVALRGVVEEGSGQRGLLRPFPFGGKTGTSRAWGSGAYDGYFASFAGIFPIEDPELVIVVRLFRPSGPEYFGGAVAAPIAREIIEQLLAVPGVLRSHAHLARYLGGRTLRPDDPRGPVVGPDSTRVHMITGPRAHSPVGR